MYSQIKIYGGCDVNYLNIQKGGSSSSEIASVAADGLQVPEWSESTIMLSTYQDSLNATPFNYQSGTIVGYKIQRKDVNSGLLKSVANTTDSLINDYNVCSDSTYQYYSFPIISVGGEKILGNPIITDEITPIWDMCVISGLKKSDIPNQYLVDTDNIWKLQLNIELEHYKLNTDKTFTDGFGRFPKLTQGSKRYLTGGINSIMGMLTCLDTKTDVGVKDMEKWESFCYSSCLKLYSDMHGRVIPIDINGVECGYLNNSRNSPIITNISFMQMADANDISVYGLVGG